MISTSRLLLVAAGSSLFLGSAAEAGFTGLVVEIVQSSDFPGLDLAGARLAMQFDNPLDRGYAAYGSPASPLSITPHGGGTFYENPLGLEIPPNAAVAEIFPSLLFDTFVTFNTFTDAEGPPPNLSPGFPHGADVLANGLSGTNIGWFVTPSSPLALPDANGQVFIAQFMLDLNAQPTSVPGASGYFNVQWDDPNGNAFQTAVFFEFHFHLPPSPGTLPALAAAAMLVPRRRRRMA